MKKISFPSEYFLIEFELSFRCCQRKSGKLTLLKKPAFQRKLAVARAENVSQRYNFCKRLIFRKNQFAKYPALGKIGQIELMKY